MGMELTFVELPKAFVEMLSNTYTGKDAITSVVSIINANSALAMSVERAFTEFNEGRGLEKIISALGWPNFRERVASLFIYKIEHGKYPEKTHMELIEDIKNFEAYYFDHSVHSNSRIFLLAFYLKIAETFHRQNFGQETFKLADFPDVKPWLNMSQARSEKLDWIILMLAFFQEYLGKAQLHKKLAAHATFKELFNHLSPQQQKQFHSNLLAYGMSIGDTDIFLYERV